MGDRKGKKDKAKGDRQKKAKHQKATKQKQDKRQPQTPSAWGQQDGCTVPSRACERALLVP